MADHPDKVAPHLHISMQSGSDRVLRRMRRRWGAGGLSIAVELCEGATRSAGDHDRYHRRISRRDRCGVRGDDRQFRGRLAFRRYTSFLLAAAWHAGGDDAEPGTEAGAAGTVARTGRVEAELRDEYYRGLLGRKLRALVETEDSGFGGWTGTSCRYATVQLPCERAR